MTNLLPIPTYQLKSVYGCAMKSKNLDDFVGNVKSLAADYDRNFDQILSLMC